MLSLQNNYMMELKISAQINKAKVKIGNKKTNISVQ